MGRGEERNERERERESIELVDTTFPFDLVSASGRRKAH